MCGLIGWASTDGITAGDLKGFLHEGLVSSMWRGIDGTGVALVGRGKEREPADVYKDSLPAYDFCRRPFMLRSMEHMDEFSMALGHTRSATFKNTSARNAHPFQYGPITLVHNGVINNAWDLTKHDERPKDCIVDSDQVCFALSRLGDKQDEQEILEQLRGVYTLIWHNAKDGSLNIARNEQRPLFFAFIKKVNAMAWASTATLLYHLLDSRNIDIDGEILYPPSMEWLKFKIEDLRRFTSRPFVDRPRNRYGQGAMDTIYGTTRVGMGGQNGTTKTKSGSDDDYPEPSKEEQEAIRRQMAAEELDMDDTKSIREYLQARNSRGTPLKRSGHPSTIKKVQTAARALSSLGFAFNQSGIIKIMTWKPYKKNQDKLGQIQGVFSRDGKTPIIMHNVLKEDWLKYKEFGKIYISCVNVRKIDNGALAVVAIEHPKHLERQEAFFRDSPESQDYINKHPYLLGPAHQLVTREEWVRLTKDGCSNCTGNINPKFAHRIAWMGHDMRSPVCHICVEDPDFRASITVPDYHRANIMH